ncbi:MAG: hypothetical protein GX775_01680 [Erysipelothrix sp.]|nr:hypothetical protein [Erysipelothrix sp.]
MKKKNFVIKMFISILMLFAISCSVVAIEPSYITFATPDDQFIIETTYPTDSFELTRHEDNKSVTFGVKDYDTNEEVEWWVFEKEIEYSLDSDVSPASQGVYRHTNIKDIGSLGGKLNHEVVLERSSGTYYSQFLYLNYDQHWISGFSYFSPISFTKAIVPDPNSPSGNSWPAFGVRVSYSCVVQAAIPFNLNVTYKSSLLGGGFTLGATVGSVVYYTKNVTNTYVIKAMSY